MNLAVKPVQRKGFTNPKVPLASYADVLRLVTRSSLRTSAYEAKTTPRKSHKLCCMVRNLNENYFPLLSHVVRNTVTTTQGNRARCNRFDQTFSIAVEERHERKGCMLFTRRKSYQLFLLPANEVNTDYLNYKDLDCDALWASLGFSNGGMAMDGVNVINRTELPSLDLPSEVPVNCAGQGKTWKNKKNLLQRVKVLVVGRKVVVPGMEM